MSEISEMQVENLKLFVGREMWAVVAMPDGTFGVYHQTATGVWPTTRYPTRRAAAARLLQLASLGPVGPQIGPENIEISEVQ